ncbi:MAG TPA: peptidoglycan-binding domain-containing protein [Terriglobales bacterium]|nr:peptidoglycan-binding domain-containing protein [Terriglobales bacterium]
MRSSKSWSKNAGGVAGTMLLVSALAFSQTDQTSPAKTKPARKAAANSSSSSAHPSSKSHTTKSRTTSARSTSHKGKRSSKTSWRRGQQKVDAGRAREIQEALIRQHYLSGSATGKWDAATEDALRKYQGDNGWQNKTVPDSRALIKLGLGPNHDHLLNPESAMTTAPDAPRTSSVPAMPPTHQADPAGSPNQPQP